MPPTDQSPRLIRFGLFAADPAAGELWRDGLRVHLQDLPFRLLVLLASRAGQVVGREELQSELWPGVEFGEFEQGLNTAVKKVRQALGDSADNPRFLETIPRKGYRFIAPVIGPPVAEPAPEPGPPPPSRKARWPIPAVLAVAAVLAISGWWILRPSRLALPKLAAPVPFTALTGIEAHPAFSPDGTSMAFAWNGGQDENFDIYVKPRDGESLRRLTSSPANDYGPVWSPDGQRIAFVRALGEGGRHGIFVIPVLGGAEVKVADVPGPALTLDYVPLAAWSPDGRWLAVSGASAEKGSGIGIDLVSLTSGEKRRITTNTQRLSGDLAPAFSPDGRWLAFLRFVSVARTALMVMPLGQDYSPAGDPKALKPGEDGTVYSFAWMSDSRQILLAKPWRWGASEDRGLWLADRIGTVPPMRIDAAPPGTASVTVSGGGDIAYGVLEQDLNIWRTRLDSEGKAVGTPERFIASTMDDLVPKFSPDGRQIVFVSKRSGAEEVWVCRSDGSGALQLTHMGYAGSPSWNPDGTRIVFDSMKQGQYEVYTIPASGGEPRRLTNDPAIDGVASYSADGKYIYFMSNRSGAYQVWRMRDDGGEPVQITRQEGYLARETTDGRWLYYFRSNRLRRVPSGGGPEVEVLPSIAGFLNFTLVGDSVYFIPRPESGGERVIERWDARTGERSRVLTLPKVVRSLAADGANRLAQAGLSLSPDGITLLWSQADSVGGDVMWMRALK